MIARGLEAKTLDPEDLYELQELGKIARGDILKMTTLAGSGHPGGSMSSIDIYLILYRYARVNPDHPYHSDQDRIVISHGHTSPGVYTALGRTGFLDIHTAISEFRKAGSIFEGHVERGVPGIQWSTGNLGQGLSAGCGFALATKLLKKNYHVFVVMGDGEQQKGQISEARRFAKKYHLTNLTVIIDHNRLQLSGPLEQIMPQQIRENYLSDGWEVIEINGHDYQEIYQALRQAVHNHQSPVAIIAHTVMGKGVSFMENKFEYHGKALTPEQYQQAMAELGLKDDLDQYREKREKKPTVLINHQRLPLPEIKIDTGNPRTYDKDAKIDNRTAFGNALLDLARLNHGQKDRTPIAVLDCDLTGSVKTDAFATFCPQNFFQGGIQEHNTATIAGTLSTQPILTFFADFGVFGVDETYNQQRINDINNANLKLICTHNGLDVGEDGKTHQCIDYAGIIQNLPGYKIIVPADPNQTDRVIRYLAQTPGSFLVAMGRSRLPVILKENGELFFSGNYQFIYGKAEIIREGKDAAIITMGTMVHRAVKAYGILKNHGYRVRIVNMSCLSDPDREIIVSAAQTGVIVTYEDHYIKTGLGSIIANVIAEDSLSCRFRKMGIKNFGASGSPEDLFRLQGLGVEHLVEVVIHEIKKK